MGSRNSLLLLAVVVLLVAGLFTILKSGDPASGDSGEGVAQVSVPSAAEEEAGDAVEMVPAPPLDGAGTAARSVVETAGDPAALTSGTSGETPRIRGRVVDKMGNGIGGATVLTATRGFGPLDAEETLFRAERWDVETDADGNFELVGPNPGRLRLAVRAAGYAPYDRNDLTLPAGEEAQLDPVYLSLGAILSGRVVDPDGHGVAGAQLQRTEPTSAGGLVYFGSARSVAAVTDENGAFRIDQLACGAWKIAVATEDFPDRTFEGTADDPGREYGGLLFQLEPGNTIAGRLEGIPEDSTERLQVRAGRAGGDGWGDFSTRSRVADVAEDGTFEVKGLALDRDYSLQARERAGGEQDWFGGRSRSEAVTARAGERGLVLTYMPEAALLFQVADAKTGAPLTDFDVEVGVNWPRPLTDADNKRLRHHPEGRVRAGDLRPDEESDRIELELHAVGYRDYERDDIRLAAGEELDLGRILLEPVPVLRVTVLDDEHGGPVEDALVELEKQPDPAPMGQRSFAISMGVGGEEEEMIYSPGDGTKRARTDEHGVAVLTSLEGETCVLTTTAPGYAKHERRGLQLPVGESAEERLRLLRGGEVRVTVFNVDGTPRAGARVERRSPSEASSGRRMIRIGGGGSAQHVTDSEGKVLFENLETGVHTFRLAESGGGPFGAMMAMEGSVTIGGMGLDGEDDSWSEVEVLEGETAELELIAPPRGSLLGRVREAGVALAGATITLAEDSGGGGRGGMSFMLAGLGGGETARTDGDGFYEFPDLKTGSYSLTISHPSRHMNDEFELDVDAGDNRFDMEVPVSIVQGRITSHEGEPLVGLRVSAERHQDEGPRVTMQRVAMFVSDGGDQTVQIGGDGGGDSALTDADGRYELRGVLSDIDLVITASGTGVQEGASEPLKVAPDEVKDGVDFQLYPAGKIRVEAFTSTGDPARFLSVTATLLGEDADSVEPERSFIESGSAVLDGLRPGRWAVHVGSVGMGNPDDEDEGQTQEVEVKAAEEATVTFTVD